MRPDMSLRVGDLEGMTEQHQLAPRTPGTTAMMRNPTLTQLPQRETPPDPSPAQLAPNGTGLKALRPLRGRATPEP
jgi:hypothetical protein